MKKWQFNSMLSKKELVEHRCGRMDVELDMLCKFEFMISRPYMQINLSFFKETL